MPLTMEERFELAKAQQLARSQKIKGKVGRKEIVKFTAGLTQMPASDNKRKKYKNKLLLTNTKCQICQTPFTENTRFIHLDHCHTTNEIRGVLCHNCNIGLGCFKDNPDFLKGAIEYLMTVDRKTRNKYIYWWYNLPDVYIIDKLWWWNLPDVVELTSKY